jgi:hypothetical protein
MMFTEGLDRDALKWVREVSDPPLAAAAAAASTLPLNSTLAETIL